MTDSLAEVMRGFAMAFVLGALAFVVAECGNVREVRADDTTHERMHADADPTTILLRVVVAEEGIRRLTPGHGAILEVLRRRSPGRRLSAAFACRYSAAFDRGCKPEPALLERDPWVPHLTRTCDQPAQWHSRLSWPAYAPGCLAIVDAIERYISGTLTVPLDPGARHFGAPRGVDLERAKGARWRLVHVPGARSLIWAVE